MLFAGARRYVVESFQGSFDISPHGNVYKFLFVIPNQVEATVTAADPINSDFIIVLESLDKVHGVVLVEVFNSKVVDAEGELGGPGLVTPQHQGSRAKVRSRRGQGL